jgi:hypothetical protein
VRTPCQAPSRRRHGGLHEQSGKLCIFAYSPINLHANCCQVGITELDQLDRMLQQYLVAGLSRRCARL